MSDTLSSLRLPLLLVSLLLVIGGSRFDALRPAEGEVIALSLPVVTACAGAAPFRDAHAGLRSLVYALGAGVVVLVEIGCYHAIVEGTVSPPGTPLTALLCVAAVCSVLFEVLGAQRGLRTRLTAWLGIPLVFGVFFPGHVSPQNLFGSVFAAFIVSFLLGGAGGLFAGEVAVRAVRG